jgi:alpha-glucuronidase
MKKILLEFDVDYIKQLDIYRYVRLGWIPRSKLLKRIIKEWTDVHCHRDNQQDQKSKF